MHVLIIANAVLNSYLGVSIVTYNLMKAMLFMSQVVG